MGIFRTAFSRFNEARAILSEDAFVVRTWGDALHDCAKKIIHRAHSDPFFNSSFTFSLVIESTRLTEDEEAEYYRQASDFLREASARFEAAVGLRKDYTNALVWKILLRG